MPRSPLTVLAVVIFMPLTTQAQSGALQGRWTITEVSVSTPDTSWTEASSQPSSFYVFVNPPRIHIVSPFSSTTPRRTLLIQGREFFSDEPTDVERLVEAFGPLVAESGTYAVSGTPLTIQPLVALYQNAVSDNSEYTYTHRVEGDTLRLTLSAAWAEGGEVRYTLARRR